MVRKLKYHEEKLLKKVDFMNWKVDNNLHEAKVLRKYHVRKREDYTKWVNFVLRLIALSTMPLPLNLFSFRFSDTTNCRERYVNWPPESVKSMPKIHFARKWVQCCWRSCTWSGWYQRNGIWTMPPTYRPAVFAVDDCQLWWSEVSAIARVLPCIANIDTEFLCR